MLRVSSLHVFDRQLYGHVRAAARDRVEQRPVQVYVERVAELVLPRLSGELPAVAASEQLVSAQPVLVHLREHLAQRALRQLPHPARGDLQPVPLASQVARLLQLADHLLKLLHLAPRVLSQVLLNSVQVHVFHVAATHHRLHLVVQLVHIPKLLHQPHGLLQRNRLVAHERILVRHIVERKQLVHQRSQLRKVAHHGRVHARLQHVHQFIALPRRHRVHQRLHGRHLLLKRLDQFVQACRRVVAEHIAVLLHEPLEVRILAHRAVVQHLVQRLDHLLHPLHVFRRHILNRVLHALEEVLHHLLAERVHKLLELLARLRVHEIVVRKLPHLSSRALRQRVQPVRILTRLLFQHVHSRLQRIRQIARLFQLLPRVGQPALDAGTLRVYHILEPLRYVVHHRFEVVLLKFLLLEPLQPLPKLAQSCDALPLLAGHSAAHQIPHRAVHVPVLHDVIRQRVQNVVLVEVERVLRPVPP